MPFVFPDVVTLDQYVNTVRPCFDSLERPPSLTCTLGQAYRCLLSDTAQQKVSPVSICGERITFTQSDMDDQLRCRRALRVAHVIKFGWDRGVA